MFNSYSSTNDVGSPDRDVTLRDQHAPSAHSRYDDIPEYPGRFRGWYSHVEQSPSPSLSPILVPTVPASPILPPTTQLSIEDVQLTALITSLSSNKDDAVRLKDQTEREKQVLSQFFCHFIILMKMYSSLRLLSV